MSLKRGGRRRRGRGVKPGWKQAYGDFEPGLDVKDEIVVRPASAGLDTAPALELLVEVEGLDNGFVLPLAPFFAGQHPHDFELISIGVVTVEALRRAVAGLTGVGAGLDEEWTGCCEVVDGVDLPRQVVEPDLASLLRNRVWSEREESQVVVVSAFRQAQEGCPGEIPRRQHFHAHHRCIELDSAFQVAYEKDRMVEAGWGYRHSVPFVPKVSLGVCLHGRVHGRHHGREDTLYLELHLELLADEQAATFENLIPCEAKLFALDLA